MRTYADICDLQAIAQLANAHPKYVQELRDKEEAERSQRYQGSKASFTTCFSGGFSRYTDKKQNRKIPSFCTDIGNGVECQQCQQWYVVVTLVAQYNKCLVVLVAQYNTCCAVQQVTGKVMGSS